MPVVLPSGPVLPALRRMVSNRPAGSPRLCLTALQQAVNLECFSCLRPNCHGPHQDRRTDRRPDSSSAACRRKASSSYSAIRAARSCGSTTSCSSRTRCGTCWCATSRARRTPPTAIRASSHKVGVCLVTSGPGRDQCGDRHRDRVHGFDPDGDHQRPGADARHRRGRVPGMRHGRHHAPLREAQLPGARRQGPRGDDEEGLPHRHHRPPGPGAGRHPEGRHRATRASSSTRKRSACAPTTR